MNPKDMKWMKMCFVGAELFSTCAKRQYFAILLDEQGHVLGTGYNGGPKGMKHCADGACPRLAANSPSGASYENCIAIHAEANALLHSDYSARRSGTTLYVNGIPCFSCAKLIVNGGVKRLVIVDDPSYVDWGNYRPMIETARIEIVSLDPKIVLDIPLKSGEDKRLRPLEACPFGELIQEPSMKQTL